jgi:hypothetical protein
LTGPHQAFRTRNQVDGVPLVRVTHRCFPCGGTPSPSRIRHSKYIAVTCTSILVSSEARVLPSSSQGNRVIGSAAHPSGTYL